MGLVGTAEAAPNGTCLARNRRQVRRGQSDGLNPRLIINAHGRANDWREVQAYLEKDLGFDTKELAQEASTGMTILGSL